MKYQYPLVNKISTHIIFAICCAKNGNFQIDLEVTGGPGEFFHGQVIIKIGLNFHFLGVTKPPRPPQNLAILTAVLSTVGGLNNSRGRVMD